MKMHSLPPQRAIVPAITSRLHRTSEARAVCQPLFEGNPEDKQPKSTFVSRLQRFFTSFPTVSWLISQYGGKSIPAAIQASHEKLLNILPLEVGDEAREAYRTQLAQDYRTQRITGKTDAQIAAEYERLVSLAHASESQLGKLEALGYTHTLKSLYEQDQKETTDCVNTLLLPNLPESLRRIDTLGGTKTIGKPEVPPVVLAEALDTLSNILLCDVALYTPVVMKPDGSMTQEDFPLYTPEELRDSLASGLSLFPETAANILKWVVQAARFQPNLLGGFKSLPTPDGNVILTPEPGTDPQQMSLRARWSQSESE